MKKPLHTFVVLAYKTSPYLEACIRSVLDQKYPSKVVIATSTPNDFIKDLAQKYDLPVFVNKGTEKGIGKDFDFAIRMGKTPLVTVAHQDDVYDVEYSSTMIEKYHENHDALIIFPDYYELKQDKKETNNLNLKIKRLLLFPIRWKGKAKSRFLKRWILRFGDPIGCPSVTFLRKNITFPVFDFPYQCDVDWAAWENMSRQKGTFVYVPRYLMGHRIHEDSTTTSIIENNIRTEEDYQVLRNFWPKPIAKLIARVYRNSEKNNRGDEKNVRESKK